MTALTPLDELWLTEAVRLREQHAGPLDDDEASRRARATAGDLLTRIRHRALWLAERDGMLAALRHWKQGARLSLILLFSPFALWILLLIILPHIGMVLLSFREKVAPRVYEYSFANYLDFINEPIYWNTLLRTGSMSLLVTALALLIGFPIAYYIAKIAGPRARGGLFLLCLIPLWVSDLIRAFGWILLLRETGIFSGLLQWAGLAGGPVEFLYNDVTVIIGLVYTVILFMIVPLVSTLDGMDNSMIEAGYNLGGSGFTVLRKIIVPQLLRIALPGHDIPQTPQKAPRACPGGGSRFAVSDLFHQTICLPRNPTRRR